MSSCARCGKPSLGPEDLTEEWLPFRGRQRYCQPCHWRLLQRLFIGIYVGWFLLGVGALTVSLWTGQNPLENTAVWLALLCILQLLFIVPHELGHALVAKWLGYSNIRILVGSGKPFFTFHILDSLWMFNRVPFGGFTLALPPAQPARWKEALFIAGGPAVNALFILLALPFFGSGGLVETGRTLPGLLVWSNVMVLVENLSPRTVPSAYGLVQTDGLLLWQCFFGPGDLRASQGSPIPGWQVILSRILKGIVVAFLALAAALCFWLTGFPFTSDYAPPDLGRRLAMSGLFSGLGAGLAWAAWKVAREPISLRRKGQPPSIPERASHELLLHSRWAANAQEVLELERRLGSQDYGGARRLVEEALVRYPDDLFLLTYQARIASGAEGNWQLSEHLYDQAMRLHPNLGSLGYSHLLLAKLHCVMEQKAFDRAREISREFVDTRVPVEAKVFVLDGLASDALYRPEAAFLAHAEWWSRKALELAPGELTLKGTLGGVLAEQHRDGEAEPLLRACLDGSPAFHDQGIAAFYLGILCVRRNQLQQAKDLLTRAMALHPVPWLVDRAKQLMPPE